MATENMTTDSGDDAIDSGDTVERQAIVVDLGKQKRRRIKQLRRGKGRLTRAVFELIDQIKNGEESKTDILPVVVVVRERRKRQKLLGWL